MDFLSKKIAKCIVQRFLGHFFEEKLASDQLKIDWSNFSGSLQDIALDVQALNKLAENQNFPFEFLDGYLHKFHINLRRKSFAQVEAFNIEVTGLRLTVQPKERHEPATSMFESMWNNSMTSSMQLAAECAQENCSDNNSTLQSGQEVITHKITGILAKVRVILKDTIIQMEYVPPDSITGVGLLMHIDLMEYSDEAGNDPTPEEESDNKNKSGSAQSYSTKNFVIEGVTFSTVEFSCKAHTTHGSNECPTQESDDYFYDKGRHQILCGKISNRQEIRVRLKQSEDLAGPKISIDVNLGAITWFLSPRQFHVISELVNGSINAPHNVNVPCKTQRPMTASDFQKIEQDLQQNFHNVPGAGLQAGHGWSAPPFDESEQFFPFQNVSNMAESTHSNMSNSLTSSITTSCISFNTEHTQHTRNKVHNSDYDPDISKIQLRIASAVLVILHEDVLLQSTDSEIVLIPSTVEQYKKIVAEFFDTIDNFVLSAYGNSYFHSSRRIFEDACKLNHLRLLAAPISFEGDEKATTVGISLVGTLAAPKLEVLECLYNDSDKSAQYIQLLHFEEPVSIQNKILEKPCFKLSFKHIDKSTRTGVRSRYIGSKTDLHIQLSSCVVDFDITLMDRLNSLLNPSPICIIEKLDYNSPRNFMNQDFAAHNSQDSTLTLKCSLPAINVIIRFPVPDFRAMHDMNKMPWWKRNVRTDFMSLTMSDAVFETTIQNNQDFSEFILESKQLNLFYYESEKSDPLHLVDSSLPTYGVTFSCKVKLYPIIKKKLDEYDPEPEIIKSRYMHIEKKRVGPFSSKTVVHTSDTPHTNSKDEKEELLMPGDQEEIENFRVTTKTNCQIDVSIIFHSLFVQCMSKHIYELIYNRMNDFLLWCPNAPKHINFTEDSIIQPFKEVFEAFSSCKTEMQNESDCESDNDSDEGSNVFYSTYDGRHKPLINQTSKQSYFVLDVQIPTAILCLHTPARDVSSNIIPGHNGKLLLKIQNSNLFLVSGYEGDENLSYMCLEVEKAFLYHSEIIPTPTVKGNIKDIGFLDLSLIPIIYQSDKSMEIDLKNRGGNRKMLTVSLQMKANHETHHVKTVQVAVGLSKATLKHKVCKESNNFVSHLLDFFNVQDYPIPGYQSKDVLTELHLHFWDCAIDYRPVHLPFRTALTVGNFTISSHLSAIANTSTLLFIAEDSKLFLSDKFPPKNGIPSNVEANLRRDYVNVVELGLFELSLKTNDKKSGINPHFDLRASNNSLNISTCADTGKALMELITYYANDGDLTDNDTKVNHSHNSTKTHSENDLIEVDEQELENLSRSQHDSISELLDDAMIEHPVKGPAELYTNDGTKLFFFPDENNCATEMLQPLQQVKRELGDVEYLLNNSSDLEEDYFFVEHKDNAYPSNIIDPQIKWLTDKSVKIIEHHFAVPNGKVDFFSTPKYIPTAVIRYTLCEMTVTWNMYGGNDFEIKSDDTKKVHFDGTSCQYHRHGFNQKKPVSWIKKGGVNRDLKTLMELHFSKVRFQHDVYPEHGKHASRQVLLISDIEIRDRLEASEINKFLYQYTSESRPKQSRSNMLVVKAHHIRPDPKLQREECSIKISLQPLRLNIDQDSLLFLISFFSELSGSNVSVNEDHNSSVDSLPVMMVNSVEVTQATQLMNEDCLILLDDMKDLSIADSIVTQKTNTNNTSPLYFRNVIFSPEVPIRLDYHGKRVDMTHGPLAGLLMGLGQLNCSEIRLKKLSDRHGILGVDRLINYVVLEWISDIKRNQLPSLLGGVGPMRSVVQLFQGIKDLFWMPIEQYQKDGRIVRGLQRGANSFTTSTAMAALELTSRLIHLIQITAETAYDMLSPGPSVRKLSKSRGKKKKYQQPQDIREGVTNAFNLVKEGIGETAGNIVQVASSEHEQKGYSGALGGVLRQIPPTIIKPIILASEATNNVLGGMKSQLVPDARKEANEKWRTDDDT